MLSQAIKALIQRLFPKPVRVRVTVPVRRPRG
jgi:hypothetical protein